MSPHRCQLCGRRKGLRKGGTIVAHYVRGVPCPGAGYVPIEQDDARLVDYAAGIEQQMRALRVELQTLKDRRANWIDPALEVRHDNLWRQLDRLRARIKRLHGWAALADRQMERYGWCQRPPAYLLARQVSA